MSQHKTMAFTHFAIGVHNVDESIAFYEKYGQLELVARRKDPDNAWMSDRMKPFQLALLEEPEFTPLQAPSHIGIVASSKEEVDKLAKMAEDEGIMVDPPRDHGLPGAYAMLIRDPNGHAVEISFGQEAGFDPNFMTLPTILDKSTSFRKN